MPTSSDIMASSGLATIGASVPARTKQGTRWVYRPIKTKLRLLHPKACTVKVCLGLSKARNRQANYCTHFATQVPHHRSPGTQQGASLVASVLAAQSPPKRKGGQAACKEVALRPGCYPARVRFIPDDRAQSYAYCAPGIVLVAYPEKDSQTAVLTLNACHCRCCSSVIRMRARCSKEPEVLHPFPLAFGSWPKEDKFLLTALNLCLRASTSSSVISNEIRLSAAVPWCMGEGLGCWWGACPWRVD